MVTFDEALPMLVGACEHTAGFATLEMACVVRDLRGRLRLIVDPDPAQPPLDVGALQVQLVSDLGSYFAPPIWSTTSGQRDEARLAKLLINQASAWPEAAFDDPASGQRVTAPPHWKKLERRISKQAWLESEGGVLPPALAQSGVGIVTFYSFKGGVGRTTALVACAWQLARAGKKVVVIDLDLEAPGLGALFEVTTKRGVVDLLVDHIATGACDLDGAVADRPLVLGADGARVSVIPAGRLDMSYLEKLARLDFVSNNPPAGNVGDPSPIEQALKALLLKVYGQIRPDYILLDSRAGLHDLAGLSLHSLADVDVLVGKASEQGYRGFELTLGVLAKRKDPTKLRAIVVHSFAPSKGLPEAIADEAEFLKRSYGAFSEHIYGPVKSQTIKEDAAGLHKPVVLRRNSAFDRFASIAYLDTDFFTRDYVELRERIEDLCATPGGLP